METLLPIEGYCSRPYWRRRRKRKRRNRKRVGKDDRVLPDLVRSRLETYLRWFEGPQDVCPKPRDKMSIITSLQFSSYHKWGWSPDPSSGRHLFWWFLPELRWIYADSYTLTCFLLWATTFIWGKEGVENHWCWSASKYWHFNGKYLAQVSLCSPGSTVKESLFLPSRVRKC